MVKRWQRWLRLRLVIPLFRTRHPPEFTARGVANGVFWGLTPTVGLHTLGIGATWFVGKRLLRADSSLVQALIWVWVNNPITMIPMYYLFYLTGLWFLGRGGSAAGYEVFTSIWDRPDLDWTARALSAARTVGIPTLLGCLPYATIGGIISYRWAIIVLRRRQRRVAAVREPPLRIQD